MESEKKCPICGCREIGIGTQTNQARMIPFRGVFRLSSDVIAEICTKCGHIISMRVEYPERFKVKK